MDYEKLFDSRVTNIPPSGIRKFFDIAASMEGVISLGVGEPDFTTPWRIRRAGIASLENRKTHYTANRGLIELREAIAGYLSRRYALTYRPDSEILVTVGGSEAIDMTMRSVISPGDEVIIPQPSYVCYEPLTVLSGGVPVIIETKAEDGFRLTASALAAAITPKTKLLILPFPCNPTGAVMSREDLIAIEKVLHGTNILVLSDEIYAELTYGSDHVAAASIPGMAERTVTVGGFSKAYSMTGWRLGYACGPAPVLKQVTKIHQYAIMCAPTMAQHAAIEALNHCDDDVQSMKEEYDTRRRLIVAGFNRIGLPCHEPHGAFYAFPCIRSTGLTSDEFCEKLLYSKKVAVVPGSAFGKSGEGFVRVSYCSSIDTIREALDRIDEFVKELPKK